MHNILKTPLELAASESLKNFLVKIGLGDMEDQIKHSNSSSKFHKLKSFPTSSFFCYNLKVYVTLRL